MPDTRADVATDDINVDNYEIVDIRDYDLREIKYIQDRQWFKGIDEHRSISEQEIGAEIVEHLGADYRKWYIRTFMNDSTKVREKRGLATSSDL